MNRSKTLTLIASLAVLLFTGQHARAQADTVYVSRLFTTHLVFPTEIKYGDLSNTEQIAASVVEYSKNLLSLIAYEPFTQPANVTVLESNGNIHTYILLYKEHPSELVIDTRVKKEKADEFTAPTTGKAAPGVSSAKQGRGRKGRAAEEGSGFVNPLWKQDAPPLKDVIDYPQTLYHLAKKVGRTKVMCENIFSYSDITYVILSLDNRSGVSFEVGDATFRIEPRDRRKRKLVSGTNLIPQNKVGTLTAAPGEKSRVAYALNKTTLSADQQLVIRIFEKGGERNFEITLTADDVNLAMPPRNL